MLVTNQNICPNTIISNCNKTTIIFNKLNMMESCDVSNTTSLGILGAGGHGKVVYEASLSKYNSVIFFDDNMEGRRIKDVPLGCDCICAIGDNKIREKIVDKTRDRNWVTVIHPKAIISETASLGIGCFVGAGAVVQSCTKIGDHTIINTNAVVEHDCVIGNFCHIAPNATLCGSVMIGNNTLLGAGSVVIPRIEISNNVTVGAGSTVINSIDSNCIVVGCPAKQK